MARGNPIELKTRSFGTQGEATLFFRAMLRRYEPGDQVSDADALDLAALLSRHHEYDQKTGIGVKRFEVMITEHGTQGFRVVRVDGTGTDFSYLSCIRGRPPRREQEVCSALRWAVRPDIFAARDAFFAEHADADGRVACAVTGERIRRSQCHVDHLPPMTFEVIVATFLASRGISFEGIPITCGADNQFTPKITDEALAEDFRSYHGRVALLDVVKNTVNLAQSAKHRLRDGRVRPISYSTKAPSFRAMTRPRPPKCA